MHSPTITSKFGKNDINTHPSIGLDYPFPVARVYFEATEGAQCYPGKKKYNAKW